MEKREGEQSFHQGINAGLFIAVGLGAIGLGTGGESFGWILAGLVLSIAVYVYRFA
jgi:hypothetical protein